MKREQVYYRIVTVIYNIKKKTAKRSMSFMYNGELNEKV